MIASVPVSIKYEMAMLLFIHRILSFCFTFFFWPEVFCFTSILIKEQEKKKEQIKNTSREDW